MAVWNQYPLSNEYNLMLINLFGYENVINTFESMKVDLNFNDHKHI
jgi:hypothetical protein